jgi:hypothetical protein
MPKEQFEPLQHDFDIWYKSKKESFLYINERSRVFPRWLTTEGILDNNNVLKPINLYAKNLYPAPTILSLKNPTVLQQKTHAEIFLLNDSREFYNIDRPWIRQYYLSDQDHTLPENCFPGIFRFYIPWVIDDDLVVKIKQSDNSPFFVYEKEITFNKIDSNTKKIDPQFVHFHFKKEGNHMIDESFSKIPRQSPMYNIEFLGNDIIGERVREYYEQH